MYELIGLVAILILLQWACGRLARRSVSRMMRPAEEWEPEDVDRWLDLIEPFPLHRGPTRAARALEVVLHPPQEPDAVVEPRRRLAVAVTLARIEDEAYGCLAQRLQVPEELQ